MEYVLLDVGMGGLVIIFGGAAVIVFGIAAFFILKFSIRIIKREIEAGKEPSNPEIEREEKERSDSESGPDADYFSSGQ